MKVYKCVYIILLLVFRSEAQLPDILFPETTQSLRDFLTTFTKKWIIVTTTETIGDKVADLLRYSLRILIGDSCLGLNVEPPIVSKYNTVELVDRFLPDLISTTNLNKLDMWMEMRQLIRKHGFPLEEYKVITKDGYNLTLFRIPGNGSTVFCHHGIFESSDDFFVAGRYNSLGFLLADDGYDVWFGNSRGNKYSRKHISLEPHLAKFWNFSWHEIGIYDLPAMIDFILNKTASTTLKYIGHSQATTAFFVMTSSKPEYNEKISLMIALSPATHLCHMRSLLTLPISAVGPILHAICKIFGVHEFMADNKFIRSVKLLMSNLGAAGDLLYSSAMFLYVGMGFARLNFTNIPMQMGHFPAGCSAKQFFHFTQSFISCEFQQFDYGSDGNIKEYGKSTPPAYPIWKISVPIALFTGDNDWLAQPRDVDYLRRKLTNIVFEQNFKHLNHQDYLWGMGLKTELYQYMKKLLEIY